MTVPSLRTKSSRASAQADVTALIDWTKGLAGDCMRLSEALCDPALDSARALGARAVEARRAASLRAADLFSDQPLEGVGEDTWRRLWAAAREYSEADVATAAAEAPAIDRFTATDWPTRREQIASHDADLAVQIDALATSVTARRAALLAVLADPTACAPAPIAAAPR